MTSTEKNAPRDMRAGERIAKVMARAGLCSRREAERWIADGRVSVNGHVLATPAITVTDADMVVVDGHPLPTKEPARLWRYHKPAGLMTTHSDERGRPTVFDALPPGLPRVISVGRLDFNSEGLLLLTNDGGLARKMELPSTGWTRRYRVRAFGTVDEAALARLAKGIAIDGIHYGPIKAALDTGHDGDRADDGHGSHKRGLEKKSTGNVWLTVALSEGKNREVRRVLEHLGLAVSRLIRVAYGPFQLGNLERGDVEEVPRKVVREQLGDGSGPESRPAKARK